MISRCLGFVLGLWAAIQMAAPAIARDLTIGLASGVTAVDPHYHFTGANMSMSRHFFDTLLVQDEERRLRPGLAVSWKPIDPTTWEFKLRTGVKFHDGSDFTAEDVKFTLWRAVNVPNNPGSFEVYIRNVKEAVVVDPHTIHLRTARPHPQLPGDMSTFGIVSHRIADFAATSDFASGKAMIGTGPFKFVEWIPGDRVVAARNEAYWGERPAWDRVTFRYMTNNTARLAALLSGGTDVIELVPSVDLPTIRKRADVVVQQKIGNRLMHLQLDQHRDVSPYVSDKAGKPLDRNPFKDIRVRRAISKAINRNALVERTLNGAGLPAGQFMPEGYFGTSPDIKPESFDPDGAVKLLAEAGYPDGFALVLHGPNDAFDQDEQVIMAVAQMLSRVGLLMKAETMPRSIMARRAATLDFSMYFAGFGSDTGEPAASMRNLVSTYSAEKGTGVSNRGRYSNSRFDAMIDDALSVLDEEQRGHLIQKATEFVMADVPIIPLYVQVPNWGLRAGLTYLSRADGFMFAHHVRPVAR